MKRFFKMSAVFALSLVMCAAGLLAACGGGSDDSDDTDTEPAVTGYFYYSFGSYLDSFFHFYEDGTYYIVMYGGSFTDAGTYELLEQDMDYYAEYDEDDDGNYTAVESSLGTASWVVSLTSYGDGITTESVIALDDDTLWDVSTSMSKHINFPYSEDYDDSSDIEETFAYAVETFYYNNDSSLYLTLYHNFTFFDMTPDDTTYEGTWTVSGSVYTLTEEDGDVFTLTVNGDGTATYVRGDDTLELADELQIAYEFTGSAVEGEGVYTVSNDSTYQLAGNEMEFVIECDPTTKTYVLVGKITIYGNALELAIDTGSYTDDGDPSLGGLAPLFVFESDNGATVTAAADTSTASSGYVAYTVTYTLAAVDNISFDRNGGTFAAFTCTIELTGLELTYDYALTY